MTFFTRAGAQALLLLLIAAHLGAATVSRDGTLVSSAEFLAQTTNVNEYWLEAECAEVGAGWDVLTSPDASGETFVVYSKGNSMSTAPADRPVNQVRFVIPAAEAGTYRLFGRVATPSKHDDSFWVRVNGSPWFRWWQGFNKDGNFHWHEVGDNAFELQDGINTVEVAYREDGASLDKIMLTSGQTLPTGFGAEASFACNPEPAMPTAVAKVRANFPVAPATVDLDASNSFDPNNDIVSYEWSYSSGTATGISPSIVLEDPADYTITLTVTDATGLFAKTYVDVRINPAVSRAVNEFWLEAECAEVGSAWTATETTAASGFQYVSRVKGSSVVSAPADVAENRVRFTIDRAQAGEYSLFARVNAATSRDNSFYVRANDGEYVRWDFHRRVNAFVWRPFTLDKLNLTEGVNTIDIAYREDGTLLDKIVVKQSEEVPASGFGMTALNCGPVALAFGCESAQWSDNFFYELAGNQVLYEGAVWENQFATGGDIPGTSTSWFFVEQCASGSNTGCESPAWSADVNYSANGVEVLFEGAVYSSNGPTQGDLPSESASWSFVEECEPLAMDCSFVAQWGEDEVYFEPGIQVVYEGDLYVSTDYSEGIPPNETEAFELQGPCQTGTDEVFRPATTATEQENTQLVAVERVGNVLAVYPTVTSEVFNVSIAKPAVVSVFDGSGRVQVKWDLPAGAHQLSLPAALPGMYYVRAMSEDGSQATSRLIVE